MLLKTSEHQIYYIALDAYDSSYAWNKNYVQKNSLSDWVMPTCYGTEVSNPNYKVHYSFKDDTPEKALGIYLGDPDCINTIIDSKLNKSHPSTFEKVYFDPNCKYPRFKLSTMTNIKRCLDANKADSIIISHSTFSEYKPKLHLIYGNDTDVLILYSAITNSYYFLDYVPKGFHDKNAYQRFQQHLSKHIGSSFDNLYDWASALISCNILPSDCTEFYKGKVILITSESELKYFDNLINNYMLLTYDTELDKFVCNGMPKPIPEDLSTLNNMLTSSDNSIVGMGIKLLSSYDLTTSICAIGTLIAKNWGNISNSTVSKSVGFGQVLATLGLTRDHFLTNSYYNIINQLYKNSTDTEDKSKAREVLIQSLTKEMQAHWERIAERPLSDLNFSLTIKIE